MATTTDFKLLQEKPKLLKKDIINLYNFTIDLLTLWGDTTAHINYVKHLRETFVRREITRPQASELVNIIITGLTIGGGALANTTKLQNLLYAASIYGIKRQVLIDLFDVLIKENTTGLEITAVAAQTGISVPNGTAFANIPFPATVKVTTANGATTAVRPVVFAIGSYNSAVNNPYTLTGAITLSSRFANTAAVTASIVVTVF